ncbi:zinc finger, CCHC-type containing protein [Tanacetum coccineum]
MDVAALKHMASNFSKLNKFEGVNFRRWQKKMYFLLSSMSVVYVLTTHIPDDDDDATVDQIRKKVKWDNNDYVCRDSLEVKYMAEDASSKKFLVSNFINYKMTDSRPVMKQYNELFGILRRFTQHKMNMDEAIQVFHLRIKESLKTQDSDKLKGNNFAGPSVVNMVEHNNSSSYNDNKGKRKQHDNTKADPNKKSKDNDVAWWVDSRATVHVCKDRCWFKTYESLNNGSILHMENESTALVHERGCVELKFSSGKIVSLLNIVNDNIGSAFMLTSKLNDSIPWHARMGHVHFKKMQDMSKDGLIPAFDKYTKKYGDVKGVTTRGEKTTTQDVHDNDANVVPKEPLVVELKKPVGSNKVLTNNQTQVTSEPVVQPSNEVQTPQVPFPKRLRKEKEEAQQKKFLENLKQLHINLPFIEALAQMPKYAKFLKGLLTNKARLEEACKITMNERCSAVLLNKLPSKEKNPGSFTIPCDIGQLHIDNALADLGASISLMPYTMYKIHGLG